MPCPAVLAAAATSIVIAGQPYDVGRPVVLWCDDDRGFDAYSETCVESGTSSKCCKQPFRRYGTRGGVQTGDLHALTRVVSQLVLHHDGCVNSRSCFHSMHDMPRPDGGCGLSAHFMIDADGTIYQTLDVAERAMHAGPANEVSIGVEMCNRADASRNELDRLPAEYRTRPVREVVINNHTYQAFDFRPEQYTSVIALARTLVRVFPNIRPEIPEKDGQPYLSALADPGAFHGIVGHLHVDPRRRKWDPGAFDWRQLLDALNGIYLPVQIRGYSLLQMTDAARLQTATRAALFNVEERAGGSYPVGLGGVWDPGVQVRAAPGSVVRAPARGVVVAARLRTTAQSASSFVLIRHELETNEGPVRFFSLLSGLTSALTSDNADGPEWLRNLARTGDRRAMTTLGFGDVALLDQPIEAGDVIGRAGGTLRSQPANVRMEIFTEEPLPGAFRRVFRYLDAAADGPVCRRTAVLNALGVKDGSQLGYRAIREFLQSGPQDQRQALRRYAIRLQHPGGDRFTEAAFVGAKGLGALTAEERARVYAAFVADTKYLTDAVTSHAGLPADQRVYFHHPITFLSALAQVRARNPLRWPAANIVDQAVPLAAHQGRAAIEWLSPVVATNVPTGPLFGPLVVPQFRAKKRAEIPLFVLPSLDESDGKK